MKNILKKYIFQTGHGKGLAKTEILAVMGNPGDVIKDEVEDGFVVMDSIDDPVKRLARMGGVVRITEVLQEGPARMPLNFTEWVAKAIQEEVKNAEGKVRFGLSMHPKSEKILKKTLIEAKKLAKAKMGNLRFVNKDFRNLSSVQAWHENLVSDGAIELHLFKSDTTWYLTKTLAIQNFEWYSHRDYDRPAKSPKVGMFPPKLAQILINISQSETGALPSKDVTIFDPFCGSGTLLQEAWLMGYSTLGSDIKDQLVHDAKENLEWLKGESQLDSSLPLVFEADATTLTADQLPKGEFAIVTETWLGPNLTKVPSEAERMEIHEQIVGLYRRFFENLKTIAPGTTVVFTAPFHKDKNQRFFIEKLPELLSELTTILPLSEHERPSLFYERKQQIVGREIWKVQV